MKEKEAAIDDMDLFKFYQTTKVLSEEGKLITSNQKIRNDLAQRNAKLVTFVINKFYSKFKKKNQLQ